MGCRGHERGVVSIFEEVKSGETLSIGFVAWFSLPFPLCSKKMIQSQAALDVSNVLQSVAQV
jgi:hypothetical protein